MGTCTNEILVSLSDKLDYSKIKKKCVLCVYGSVRACMYVHVSMHTLYVHVCECACVYVQG